MNTRITTMATLALLVGSTTAVAQIDLIHTFRILPGSEYMYLPSGEGPGIPGCDPSDLQCDFEISGTFDFEMNEALTMASIVNADLTLIGNESVAGPGLTTAASVESYLESQAFEGVASIPEVIAFQTTDSFGDLSIVFDIPGFGDSGVMDGGFDARPVDGDGNNFGVKLLRIPEPSTVALLLVGAFGLIASRPRR